MSYKDSYCFVRHHYSNWRNPNTQAWYCINQSLLNILSARLGTGKNHFSKYLVSLGRRLNWQSLGRATINHWSILVKTTLVICYILIYITVSGAQQSVTDIFDSKLLWSHKYIRYILMHMYISQYHDINTQSLIYFSQNCSGHMDIYDIYLFIYITVSGEQQSSTDLFLVTFAMVTWIYTLYTYAMVIWICMLYTHIYHSIRRVTIYHWYISVKTALVTWLYTLYTYIYHDIRSAMISHWSTLHITYVGPT